MHIQPITNYSLNPVFTGKKPKENSNYVTKPSVNDSFESSNKEFNLDNSMKTLSDVRMPNGKKKFNQNNLAKLENYLIEEPKKWNSIYTLSKNPNMKADFVYLMTSKPLDHLNMLTQISETKDKKGDYKYSGKEMMHFTDKLMPEDLKRALPLTKTKLSVENIVLTAQTPNIPSTEKITDKVLEMENVVGDKLEEIQFTKNRYVKDEYVISAKNSDKNVKTVGFDKNLNRQTIEDVTHYENDGKRYVIKKTTDLRNNNVSKVRLHEDDSLGRPVFDSEVRIVKDKNGKINHYEYVTPSVVKGVYDITYKTPSGKEKKVSSGKIDKKTGIVSVKKDMTSPDGTRTQYLYENDPLGNRIVDYKITDKNGKILLNKSQTFEVINENKFITSRNNDKFEINIDENSISVQDLKNKKNKAVLTAKDNFIGDKKKLLSTLKQIPGEELIKLGKSIDFLESIDDSLDSYYNGSCRSISTGDDPFLFLHELGHATDFNEVDGSSTDAYEKTMIKSITMDKDVNKAFEEEKSAFFKAYPDTQREHMDYFMNILNHYNGETGGLQEAIAETNALLSEAKSHDALAIRSQYFQQNFPKTIAVLETKLNK